jgi:hypothetical protein
MLQWSNVALRGLMEAGVVVALAWWGVHTGTGAAGKAALGVGAPAVGFGLWGLVDFRQAGRAAEPLRLLEELLITGLAALAWFSAGEHMLAWGLVLLSVLHHALVYPLGGRLLKQP